MRTQYLNPHLYTYLLTPLYPTTNQLNKFTSLYPTHYSTQLQPLFRMEASSTYY